MWELCVPCLQDTLIAVNGESSISLGFDKAFAMIAGAGPRVLPSLPRSVLPFGIQKVVGSRGLTTRVGRGDRERERERERTRKKSPVSSMIRHFRFVAVGIVIFCGARALLVSPRIARAARPTVLAPPSAPWPPTRRNYGEPDTFFYGRDYEGQQCGQRNTEYAGPRFLWLLWESHAFLWRSISDARIPCADPMFAHRLFQNPLHIIETPHVPVAQWILPAGS